MLREYVADLVEHLGVGGGVAARRAADRPLVDVDHLVDVADARHALVRARYVVALVERAAQRRVEDVVDERGLARAGHAGDRDQRLEREVDVDVLQVVLARALDAQLLARALAAARSASRCARAPRGTRR